MNTKRVDIQTQHIDDNDRLFDCISKNMEDIDTAENTLSVIEEQRYIDSIINSIPGVTLESNSKCR